MPTTDIPPQHEASKAPSIPLILASGAAALISAWIISWAIPHPQAHTTGELRVSGLERPVSIVRDAHGIPHITASNAHDVYFAEGYVVAQDRLFQLDLQRRFVGGELAEIFGSPAVNSDLYHRLFRPHALAERMYAAMSPTERAALNAYTAGVNAAMQHEQLPSEFRFLLYTPKPWKAEDSILTGLATVLALTNDWEYILTRERLNAAVGRDAVDQLTPVGDPTYDVPIQGNPAPVSCRPPVHATPPTLAANTSLLAMPAHSPVEASNAWGVGGAHTADGRALLANDPHLDYSVPAPWYLVEMRAPGLHVTGATLPGTPGVVLGHNDAFAWGVTSVGASTVTVYRDPLRSMRTVQEGKIDVRLGFPRTYEARATPHGFVVATDGKSAYAAEWTADREARSPLGTFLSLDQASSIEEALHALSRFPGPPLNVVLGDRSGRVAYHMAGLIPNDGVWSRYVVDGSRVKEAWRGYIPFDQLPHVDPSREAIVSTANDRMYGSTYPYRLTDHFMPAYRARRIRDLLRDPGPFKADDFRRFQLDVFSQPEYEFARGAADYLAQKKDASDSDRVVAWELRSWDGRMQPESRVATLAYHLRDAAVSRYASLVLGTKLGSLWRANVGASEATASMLCAIRSHAVGYAALLDAHAVKSSSAAWETEHRVFMRHPLHAFGVSLFDPPPFGGNGDFASISVQTPQHGQSFRAVWSVGAWDQGGIVMPLGESGRFGSPNYDDEEQAFKQGKLLPLTLAPKAPGTQILRLEPES